MISFRQGINNMNSILRYILPVAPMLKLSAPYFNPLSGNYTVSQNVIISCLTSEANIYYTTNESEPTTESTLYSTPVNVNVCMDIKARAFKTGWENSDITSSIYTLSVVTPTFNPAGGEYSSSQYITLSCVTSGAEIRYTTNSIDPVISSLLYESPLNITSSMLIKAKGFKTGWVDSLITSSIYTISVMEQVATPTLGQPSGFYELALAFFWVECSTSGATIYYTVTSNYGSAPLDPANPTLADNLYSIQLPVSVFGTDYNSFYKFKIFAVKDGMIDSEIIQANYEIMPYT